METRKYKRARRKDLRAGRQERREKRASAAARGYDNDWERFRLRFLRHWISIGWPCALCGGPLDPVDLGSLDVDHVIPIRERPDLRLEPQNCRALHHACHSLRTNQYEADEARGFSTEASSNGNPPDPNHPWNEVREFDDC